MVQDLAVFGLFLAFPIGLVVARKAYAARVRVQVRENSLQANKALSVGLYQLQREADQGYEASAAVLAYIDELQGRLMQYRADFVRAAQGSERRVQMQRINALTFPARPCDARN